MCKKVSIQHGEGKTVFYAVKYDPLNEENWEIVDTFFDRGTADKWLSK